MNRLECRLKKTQLNTLKGNQVKGNGTGSDDGDVDGIVVGPQYIEIHDTKSKLSCVMFISCLL